MASLTSRRPGPGGAPSSGLLSLMDAWGWQAARGLLGLPFMLDSQGGRARSRTAHGCQRGSRSPDSAPGVSRHPRAPVPPRPSEKGQGLGQTSGLGQGHSSQPCPQHNGHQGESLTPLGLAPSDDRPGPWGMDRVLALPPLSLETPGNPRGVGAMRGPQCGERSDWQTLLRETQAMSLAG